jgi:hypothetical protein
LGALFTFSFLFWTRRNITGPIHRLEESVVAFAEKSHGQRNLKFLEFDAPSFYVKNEVYVLSNAVVKMTSDMRNYVDDVIAAERKASIMQEQANQMSELANKDSLTGVRNKTAYDKEIKNLMQKLAIDKQEAIEIYLDDHDICINETAEQLTEKAKANGVAKEMTRCKSAKKADRKRERKPDPTKEEIISNLANFLREQGVADVQIPNVGKLITFSLNDENFTLNLIRNRKKK